MMLDNIVYLISSVITSIPYVYSINFSLTPKKRSVLFSLLFAVMIIISVQIKTFCDKAFGANIFSMISVIIVQYLLLMLFCKNSWKTVLGFFLMLCTSMIINDFVCMFLFYLLGNKFQDHDRILVTSTTRFYSTLLVVIFMFVTNLIWQKINKIQHYTNFFQFFIVFFAQVFIGGTFIFYIVANDNAPIKSTTVILFTGIAWIITDIFFIKAIFDNHRKAQLKMSLDQAMEMEKMQYEYYENLTDSINSLRKYRHDLNNMLQTLSLIIKNPDTLENGQELFSQLCERYKDTQLPYYCSNPIINAVILAKSGIAEEKGISFDVSVNLENTSVFENIDLCSIFSNMLDNALEAADEVSDGEIKLSSWSDTGYLFIKCVNSYDGKIKKNGKGFVSTKSRERGLGLSIIESIAKKYGGSLIIEYDDSFSALAVLNINTLSKQ